MSTLPKLARPTRLMHDRSGVAALEFAMIAPILVLLYIGVAETGNALTDYRRTATVAATAADLTAQVKTVTKANLKDIEAASSSIMTPPSDPASLKIVLSSVVADQNNNGKVAWSCANKGSGRALGSAYPVPNGLTEPNSSLIVAEVTYDFTPMLNLTSVFSPGAFKMTQTFYTRPRRSLTVAKSDTGC